MCECYDELGAWFVMSSNVDTVNDILLLCRYHLHSFNIPHFNNTKQIFDPISVRGLLRLWNDEGVYFFDSEENIWREIYMAKNKLLINQIGMV